MSRITSQDTLHNHPSPTPSEARQAEKRRFLSKHANGSTLPYASAGNEERHSIFSSELKKERAGLWKGYGMMITMITLVLWAALPIFFGSLYLTLPYIKNLTLYLIDLDSQASGDGAIVGPAFQTLADQANAMSPNTPHLGFSIRDPTLYPNGVYDAISDVLNKNCWAAIVVHANATSAWRDAVQAGGQTAAGYDPMGSVGVYYSGARFYQVVLIFLHNLLVSNAHEGITSASQTALSTLLTSLDPAYTAPSTYPASSVALTTSSLATLTTQPSLLSNPFGYYTYDLRPVTAWAAAAIYEAADIYYLVALFPLCIWMNMARQQTGLARKLKLGSLVAVRVIPCFIAYFVFSLWATCIVAAFQVPFDTTYGHAGFVVFWMLTYALMLAVGLAFETMISILTMRFLPFFLIFWIIVNITSSFYPTELTERFYNWFIIFPFSNHVEGSKIIFDGILPAGDIGPHFGALFGWVGVDLIAICAATWWERRRDEKSEQKEREEKAKEQEKTGGENGE